MTKYVINYPYIRVQLNYSMIITKLMLLFQFQFIA